MHPDHEVPVLVVGAGPAGLASSITLARHGIESLLVERRGDVSALPRATSISTRSMELLRSWDLDARIRDGGIEVDWLIWESETLAAAASGIGHVTGMPTRDQAAVVSPVAPECVPQDHLEAVLLDHLESLPEARVERGTEVVKVAHGDDGGVHALVRDSATGRTRHLRAHFLIAADGAHSAVRRSLGIAVRGPDNLAHIVTALFRAPLWDLLPEHRYGLFSITHPEVNSVLVPAGRGDRWMFGIEYDAGRESPADYPPERMAGLIRTAVGHPDIEPRIERMGSFTFAAQIADRFRAGDVFLAGDAAHRVTPRGGTGLNSALHDGHDLGWKLAWVMRGWAGPELLDSYEAERRPVAEHNIARSLDEYGSRRPVAEEMHTDLGGRIPHVWLPAPDGRVSSLDLLGPGLTLFLGPDATEPAASLAGPAPVAVRRLDAVAARAMGIRAGGSLLVRPDGVPSGWWRDTATAVAA